ncbi:hypothetical protein ACFOEK_09570 [Litoribrevibacter euphylliae]|uniref:Uncharacterized protein n=1 Tax=Litoribrevibacter euphylliae TaxID=1834034 RepID=A0ABV7HIX0_9GAMM
MIRVVIFALALTVFCKLFLNQEEVQQTQVQPQQAHSDDVSELNTRELAKDIPPSAKTTPPKS